MPFQFKLTIFPSNKVLDNSLKHHVGIVKKTNKKNKTKQTNKQKTCVSELIQNHKYDNWP